MVAALIIAGRLTLQRERRVFGAGWVTNHGYPVLITRPTVCRVSVFRGIGRMRAFTYRWGVNWLAIQYFS